MYEQTRGDILYIMLYIVVTTIAMIASCYMLLRRSNAIAPDITPPVRLRRWTAVFFASFALNHVWYMPIFFLTSSEDIKMADLLGGLLDSLTVFPLAVIVLLTMLQDRRRQLWPVAGMFAPLVVGNAMCVATRSYALLPILYSYFLLICIGIIIYMVRATRQYGRWLRDNYADLEHKEVWQSFVVLAIILLVFAFYVFVYEGSAYLYAIQVMSAVLICYLLWRVETLSDLSIPQMQSLPEDLSLSANRDCVSHSDLQVKESDASKKSLSRDMGPLLQRHCIDTGLYLQHDLTLLQLTKAIGTNRYYLSQYFSSLGTNYNAYINDLRIRHFVRLYREAAAVQQVFTAQQLAFESGFHNYRTFSNAFKHQTGQTVTAWMKGSSEQEQRQADLHPAEREQARPGERGES